MAATFRLEGDRALALYLGNVASNVKPAAIKGLNIIGKHLEKEVKDKFGKYHSSWPKLKRASVIAKYLRRTLKGGANGRKISFNVGADDPLVLFGNLKDSIKNELNKGVLEVEVYSDNVYAAVHEYGYAPKKIPSRSYMRVTLSEESNNVVDIMDNEIGRII